MGYGGEVEETILRQAPPSTFPSTPTTPMPAATKASTKPKTTFLSQDDVEGVTKDTKADGRFISPSKMPLDKEQRFRIFGEGLTGYEGWVVDEANKAKPMRWTEKPDLEDLPANMRRDEKTNAIQEPKRFLAALVWDYQKEAFGILQITQKTLLAELMALIADEEDYGEPTEYDIKITRTGEGLQTRYGIKGAQIKAPPAAAVAAYEDDNFFCDLNHLMLGLDPWDPKAMEKAGEDPEDLD